jgi:hypothetical protein
MSDRYPKSSVVWPGAVLGYLVNCIMTAQSEFYASCCYWKGQNYSINGHGLYGTLTFEGKSLVGIFFDPHSERSPYQCPDTYDLNRFFRGMSRYHRSLAEREALQHIELFDETNIPCITTAFWDAGDYLTAADPWEVVLAEGARLVEIELIEDLDVALAARQESYQMTPEQVALARSLFQRKMAQPATPIALTPAEVAFLESTFKDPKAQYDELERLARRDETAGSEGENRTDAAGPRWWEAIDSVAEARKAMRLCRESFAAIGILVPETQSG